MTDPPMVEIVNPNGLKGLVPEGSAAELAYPRSPSTRKDQDPPPQPDGTGTIPGDPSAPAQPMDKPGAGASTDLWRTYATSHGMSTTDAEDLSRDELAEYYTEEN